MKKTLLLILIMALGQLTFAQEGSEGKKKDYTKEEKPSFVIKIDGKEYAVKEGEEIKVGDSEISVELAKEKQFDNGIYSFKYSNHFSFEYEGEPGYQNWTLDGNNFTIMMFEMDEEVTLPLFIAQMVSQFGEDNCKTKSIKKKLGRKKLKGTRIQVNLVGQEMHVDMYEVKMKDGKKHFIAFQDMLDDNNNPTEEATDALELIGETIKYRGTKL